MPAAKKVKSQWMWIKGLTAELQAQTERRILTHAAKVLPEKAHQIRVRFKLGPSEYCYIDADEGKGLPLSPLCRLGWRGNLESWDLAFYTYSNERYQPCMYGTGEPLGTPEEALEVGIVYLR
jgi:hypothetical protein